MTLNSRISWSRQRLQHVEKDEFMEQSCRAESQETPAKNPLIQEIPAEIPFIQAHPTEIPLLQESPSQALDRAGVILALLQGCDRCHIRQGPLSASSSLS